MEDYEEYEEPISRKEIYEEYKQPETWTLNVGLALLIDLKYFNDPLSWDRGYKPFLDMDLTVLKSAINAKILKPVETETLKPFSSYSNDNKDFLTIEVKTFEFLEYVKEKDLYPIPPELTHKKIRLESGGIYYIWLSEKERIESNQQKPLLSLKTNGGKKLRPDQKDKIECQNIALEVWKKYPILDIFHLKKHPDIKKISGVTYGLYKETTIHRWLSEIAPKNAKDKGKRSKETREEQKKICKKIGINI